MPWMPPNPRTRKDPVRQRVYMENGTVAHVLDYNRSANSNEQALCGRGPWPETWRGTGTQDEYDRAKELRLCVSCEAVLRHQGGGVLPGGS